MMKLRHIITLIGVGLLTLVSAKAQEIEVDWDIYAQDTVTPVFTHSIDLGYEYTNRVYSAHIEYPKLTPLTPDEVHRYHLPSEAGLPEWPEIDIYKGVSAKRGQLDISFIPIIWRDGKYQRIEEFSLKLDHKTKATERRSSDSKNRYAMHSVLSQGRWVKIRVSDNGIHMLTHAQLNGMGFSNPSKVRLYGYGGHLLSESNVEEWKDDLCEIPLWRGDDRLLFYACGSVKWTLQSDDTFTHTRNPYSNYGYYFLTEDADSIPITLTEEAPRSATDSAIVTTPAYSLHEVDDYAWFHSGRKFVESHDFAGNNVKRYQLQAAAVQPLKESTLDVCFTHNGSVSTSLSAVLDNTTLGTLTLSPVGKYNKALSATRSYNTKITPSNSSFVTVTLTHNRAAGISGRLDFLRFNYTRFIDTGTPIYATSAGIHTYKVDIATENTVVWNITDPTSPTLIPSTVTGSVLTFTVEGQRGDTYIAVDTKAQYPIPEEVGEIANQDLHATEATDYIIIVPTSGKLTAQAERLAEAHRSRSGLTVKVVHANEVYNEFSSGTPDATAYRRYLKMLYDRATTLEETPRYLLLFGDGAWDNRMVTSSWQSKSPDDYLLCFESENSFSETSSYVMEDYYGLLDDGEGASLLRDKVDVGVGRFPVTTTQQARDMVDKAIAYMNNTEAGAWKNTILVLGDDGDNNQHLGDAEAVAGMLEKEHPNYMIRRIYWDNYPMEVTATGSSYPTVRKRLLELFEEGALMVNYSGHGSPDVLSHELVINKSDMAQLRSPRLPVWVTASCDISPFDNTTESFGESAFLNPTGGAIALFTTSRTVYSAQNQRINYFFSNYLFGHDENNRRMRIGDAVRKAKCRLVTATTSSDKDMTDFSENKLHYLLLGDPALTIGNAEYRMKVDTLNGIAIDEQGEVILKAGTVVTVNGHVEQPNGTIADNFSGTLHATVFDNKETVVCRNNKNDDIEPFKYQEHSKKLFIGSDSVRSGKFNFTFRVPMDINYSMKNGLINLYAVNKTFNCEAQGTYDNFLLGDTEQGLVNDSLGPKVKLYLNTPHFVSGDKVNETPYLIANLEDTDGINTVGNSIGHDIVAIIDGDARQTYTLNSYYASEMGDYTRGSVRFSLPELTEGRHTLMFRAWDMMNNATTSHIEFEVIKGIAPQLMEVTSTHSPAREHTTFILTHDRPESEVRITVEVFDFTGRLIWLHDEQVSTPDNSYSVEWNLCNDAGAPLNSGVYLYRAIVASTSGQSASKTQKIVIIR